ncbi:hypothetical protein MHBO_002059 [Bonamia ostreae]|uniref:Cytochrome b5 heme-binding domain-containing protein n=1 Tax=Bonamia ostreae TaxID=126728 RepID=A0ABV2AL71_9EUKA
MSFSSSEDDPITLIINGHKYDVTDYINVHPGEGHNNIYLENFDKQDVTNQFNYYHKKTIQTNLKLLQRARERGCHKKIRHLGEISKD